MASERALLATRVVVSAICGSTILVLGGLWIRSFSNGEELYCRVGDAKPIGIWSGVGRLVLTLHGQRYGETGVHYIHYDIGEGVQLRNEQRLAESSVPSIFGFGAGRHAGEQFRLMVPHWFPMVALLFGAVISWKLSWRFSLRMLLVCTVSIAIGILSMKWFWPGH